MWGEGFRGSGLASARDAVCLCQPYGLSSAWRPGFSCATHGAGLLERREASGVGVLVSALLQREISFSGVLVRCLGSDEARTRGQTRGQT